MSKGDVKCIDCPRVFKDHAVFLLCVLRQFKLPKDMRKMLLSYCEWRCKCPRKRCHCAQYRCFEHANNVTSPFKVQNDGLIAFQWAAREYCDSCWSNTHFCQECFVPFNEEWYMVQVCSVCRVRSCLSCPKTPDKDHLCKKCVKRLLEYQYLMNK